jgi:PAS domain S-box-containing protein
MPEKRVPAGLLWRRIEAGRFFTMARDPLDIVAGTADPAVGTDEAGRVVIWNKAAERLFGYGAGAVLGRPCHEVLCGRDPFGNRFCDETCALEQMLRHKEAIRRFEMTVRLASGRFVRVGVSVVVVPGPRPSQHTILHLLQPIPAGTAPEIAVVHLGRTPVGAAEDPPAVSEDSHRLQPLTRREVEVLRLLADGVGTEEIADSLFISVTTVRNHVQNVLHKLDVHSKLEAVALALRRRLI